MHVIVNDLDLDSLLLGAGQILDQLPQLGATNAVCAVNDHALILRRILGDLPVLESLPQSGANLLVVALLGRLTILMHGALRVHTANEVVQLRRGEELVVGVLGTRCVKSVDKAAY